MLKSNSSTRTDLERIFKQTWFLPAQDNNLQIISRKTRKRLDIPDHLAQQLVQHGIVSQAPFDHEHCPGHIWDSYRIN